MTQEQLDQLVAEATGEDVRSIRQRGFSVADLQEVNFDPEPDVRPPLVIDWDDLDRERNLAVLPSGSWPDVTSGFWPDVV